MTKYLKIAKWNIYIGWSLLVWDRFDRGDCRKVWGVLCSAGSTHNALSLYVFVSSERLPVNPASRYPGMRQRATSPCGGCGREEVTPPGPRSCSAATLLGALQPPCHPSSQSSIGDTVEVLCLNNSGTGDFLLMTAKITREFLGKPET